MSGELLGFDDAAVRSARENLIQLGVQAVPTHTLPVPRAIERSWRRSLSSNVSASSATFPYIRSFDPDSLLVRAASPVLERLEGDLLDTGCAFFLSDGTGQIVRRVAGSPSSRNVLDSASAAEGFDFSEGSIGTNGLGTTIQERRPLLVRGSEHFSDALVELACAGAPLRHPIKQHVVGSFSIACRAKDASPAMLALAIDAARQIEQRLVDLGSDRDRAMLRCFDTLNASSSSPLLVLSEEAVLSNTAGLSYLTPGSHTRLWESLCREDWTSSIKAVDIDSPGGASTAIVERIGGASHAAFALRITQRTKRSRPPRSGDSPYQLAIQTANRADAAQSVFALAGPPGSGKTHIALEILRGGTGLGPLILDASTLVLDAEHSWFAEASAAVLAGRHVVLRHLEDLPASEFNRAKWLAVRVTEGRPGQGPAARLGLTVHPERCTPEHLALLTQLATPIVLPALRDAPHAIPWLIDSIVHESGRPESAIGFTAPALQSLMRWPWPGNVTELRRIVVELAERFPTARITNAELPTHLLVGSRQHVLSSLESAERREIVAALDRAGGNRSVAARQLGLGRTTLYRKLRQYGLDHAETMQS